MKRLASFLLLLLGAAPALTHAAPFELQRTWTGEAQMDQFGIALGAVGDLDGDGLHEFVVGANVNDELASSGGRVYVYLGGTAFPVKWSDGPAGADARGYFGQAIDGGADFDGDGFVDWVVGAPGPGDDGTRVGSAFLFLGGPDADLVADLRIDGTVPGGQFGFAVSLRGDLDGDGYADLAIGAPRAGDGEVTIVFGHDLGGPAPVSTSLLPPAAGDARFGFALSILADQDADGDDELVVGAPRSSRVAAWAGATFVFGGGDFLLDMILPGGEAGEEFGRALCSGADIDGDGASDLMVGAPFSNPLGLTDAGRVALYRAGAAFDSVADGGAFGEAANDRFGTSLAAGFDWDGDGNPDWAAGAPDHSSVALNGGAFYVYSGLTAVPGVPTHVERSDIADTHLGTSLCSTGGMTGLSQLRGGLACGGYNSVNSGRVLLFSVGDPLTAAPAARAAWLSAPSPNPFNPRTRLLLRSPVPASWTIRVIDARGRHVSTAFEGWLDAGTNTITMDAHGLGSGVYWFEARCSTGERLVTRGVLVR